MPAAWPHFPQILKHLENFVAEQPSLNVIQLNGPVTALKQVLQEPDLLLRSPYDYC
jgi:hypothetical protein